jgi:hypothetical protein
MKSALTTPTPPKTKAMIAFEENLDGIKHMTYLTTKEIKWVERKVKKAHERIDSLMKTLDLKTTEGKTRLVRDLTRANGPLSAVGVGLERYQLLALWQVVMPVTCVEAYLQDVLTIAAGLDSKLMIKSEQRVSFAELSNATSLENVVGPLRSRWARNWVADGGPARWIERLEKMGVRGFPPNLAWYLEMCWGIRHVVVHNAGIATAEFVKRHPKVVSEPGKRIKINHKYLTKFFESIRDFINPTEAYFLKRFPAMAVVAPANPTG